MKRPFSATNFTPRKPCWWPWAVSTKLEENVVHDYYQLSPHTESLVCEIRDLLVQVHHFLDGEIKTRGRE